MSPDPLNTLKLLNGQQDVVMPARLTQQVYVGLMASDADVSCNVTCGSASSVGHGLHPALMTQAVYRLPTGVPLRFWRST